MVFLNESSVLGPAKAKIRLTSMGLSGHFKALKYLGTETTVPYVTAWHCPIEVLNTLPFLS